MQRYQFSWALLFTGSRDLHAQYARCSAFSTAVASHATTGDKDTAPGRAVHAASVPWSVSNSNTKTGALVTAHTISKDNNEVADCLVKQ
jgi:hypothetical protein